MIKFYSLKTRSHVEVPLGDCTKTTMTRDTKKGPTTRYAVQTVYQGAKLSKFVSQADYELLLADVKTA